MVRLQWKLRTQVLLVATLGLILGGLIMVDLLIVTLAILALVTVASRPRRARPATALLLALLAGILLWANLRSTGWQEELGGYDAPVNLDLITKAMFWRGWPLCPCMVCLFDLKGSHPSGVEPCALVLDGAILVVALFLTKAACERCLRWLDGRGTKRGSPKGGSPTKGT